jgi:tRNA threonylcarbamoyladenosine biosynthesis protein TsaB
MKILAIDTATEACSVALLSCDSDAEVAPEPGAYLQHNTNKGEYSLDGIFEICPQQHSQQILPMIDTLLRRNHLRVSDLSAVAYGCGPGSFTGVRIAASTVQGLAFGANLPVVQVSTLATMAQQVFVETQSQEIVVLIDARMKEVYMGHFTIKNGLAKAQISDTVVTPEKAAAYIKILPSPVGVAGTGFVTYAALFNEALHNFQLKIHYPNARFMLPFAQSSLIDKTTIDVQDIEPAYVRDTVTWQKLPHKQ